LKRREDTPLNTSFRLRAGMSQTDTEPGTRGVTMFALLQNLLGVTRAAQARLKPSGRVGRPAVRPRLEALEERRLMTVTNLGGPVLPHVEVQPVYLGTQWTTPGSAASGMVGPLDTFLSGVVKGPYMDMLTKAGYGVGRGSFDAPLFTSGTITNGPPPASISQADLEAMLWKDINQGLLKAPDANRLYLVFVQPGMTVTIPGDKSKFAGFHDAFLGINGGGAMAKVRYAVVLYPGPNTTVTNQYGVSLSPRDQLTTLASHEVVEAVTDPDATLHFGTVELARPAWKDLSNSVALSEIADIVNSYDTKTPNGYSIVYLGGFAVTRVADRNDLPMTPAGAQPLRPLTVLLNTDGSLTIQGAAPSLPPDVPRVPVRSISDQSIGTDGFAMVDVLFSNNQVWEFHDGGGGGRWVPLKAGPSPVQEAVSGQGVSYVLYTDGHVWEYRDDLAAFGSSFIVRGINEIDAGTDARGVNMVDALDGTFAREFSDSSGAHVIPGAVLAISAGQQGVSAVLVAGGNFRRYDEATNSFPVVWDGGMVTSVTAGTDQNGNALLVARLSSGLALAFDADLFLSDGWGVLWPRGVQSINKPHYGVTDLIFGGGSAFAFRPHPGQPNGDWSVLATGGVQQVA
jgi:hypothetical protein